MRFPVQIFQWLVRMAGLRLFLFLCWKQDHIPGTGIWLLNGWSNGKDYLLKMLLRKMLISLRVLFRHFIKRRSVGGSLQEILEDKDLFEQGAIVRNWRRGLSKVKKTFQGLKILRRKSLQRSLKEDQQLSSTKRRSTAVEYEFQAKINGCRGPSFLLCNANTVKMNF